MIDLIGAKPVPLATNTIGFVLSSRRKKLPSGPSRRRMSRSFILLKTWSVKLPPATWRTCSSISSSVVRRVRHREAAPLAVLQQEIDVLAGEELQPLVRRQLELHHHHVVGDLLELLHAARQQAHRDVLRRADGAALDHQVAERLCLAEKRLAVRALGLGEHARMVVTVVDAAGDDLSLAASRRRRSCSRRAASHPGAAPR